MLRRYLHQSPCAWRVLLELVGEQLFMAHFLTNKSTDAIKTITDLNVVEHLQLN